MGIRKMDRVIELNGKEYVAKDFFKKKVKLLEKDLEVVTESLGVAIDALLDIKYMHDGNQSPAMNMPDLDYARRVIRSMNLIAKETLERLEA